MIEKLSRTLSNHIYKNLNKYDNCTDQTIIQYGLECILNMAIPCLFYLTYAAITNSIPETILWLFIFISYRNLIGGYHANSHVKCIIISTIYGILCIHLIDNLDNNYYQIKLATLIVLSIIHIIINPIVQDACANNTAYLRRLKREIFLMLTFYIAIIAIFHDPLPQLANIVFIGVSSAEFLFVLYRFSIFIHK